MILKRTFHPVGHGAFYTEQFYSDVTNQPCFTVVFDCGRFEAGKKGWSYPQYKKAIDGYVASDSGLISGQEIDLLFISHFHTDHIIGVEYLIANYDVKKIIIPVITQDVIFDSIYSAARTSQGINAQVSFIEKLRNQYSEKVCFVDIKGDGSDADNISEIDIQDDGMKDVGQIISCTSLKYKGWYYKPFYTTDRSSETNLIKQLQIHFPCILCGSEIDLKQLREYIKTNGVDSLKDVYASVFGKDKHNSYSLTLYSGMSCDKACHKGCHMKANEKVVNSQLCSCNCLYMGDYEALGNKQKLIKNYYSGEWENIGIVQVPHHGSEHNSDDLFYHGKKCLCIISADSNDKYDHPDQVVLDAIANSHSIPIIVSENKKTKLCFTIQIPN